MKIDWSKAVAYEKVDGSLIKIYRHKGRWHVATKGTAYAESDCMGYGITFKELVLKSFECNTDAEFQLLMDRSLLHFHNTYIFELTSVENRVVKRYEGYKIHFLAARNNEDGEYETGCEKDWLFSDGCPLSSLIQKPKEYRFSSTEECMDAAKHLKNLDEGFVVYIDGVPVAKVKSPTYVATHHIRGEGLNPKRVSQLVLSGEADEYLTYFPEDVTVIQPYIDAHIALASHIDAVYDDIYEIEDQKEFAMKASRFPFKAALFQARAKKIDPLRAFDEQRDTYKIEILKGYL